MVRFFLFTFILCLADESVAQSLAFKVRNFEGEAIVPTYLTVYCGSAESQPIDFKFVTTSIFSYRTKDSCKQLIFQFSAPGYEVERFQLDELKAKDTVLILLSRQDHKTLKPVVVKAKNKPIVVRSDTTIYDPKAFSDGMERNLETLLKKLPGIDVNSSTGVIKFKGRPIATILIEGDNLFESNYTIGSRNIRVDQVKEIQAIENFSENYVLKNLETTENVALNIKLEETKFAVSKNAEISGGVGNSLLGGIKATFLGMNRIHKFFSVNSYNNLGDNSSSMNVFDMHSSLVYSKLDEFRAPQFIDDPSVDVPNQELTYNNSQLVNNYQGLIKATPKLTIKGSFNYLSDRIAHDESFDYYYVSNTDTVTISDHLSSVKYLRYLGIEAKARHSISARSLWETSFSRDYQFPVSNVQSTSFAHMQKTSLFTKDNFRKLSSVFTTRIAEQTALQIDFLLIKSSNRQSYDLNPSIYFPDSVTFDNQTSDFLKTSYRFLSKVIGRYKKTRYHFSIDLGENLNTYNSMVISDSLRHRPYNVNDISFRRRSIANEAEINFRSKKLNATVGYRLTNFEQSQKSLTTSAIKSRNLIFEPNLNVKIPISNISYVNIQIARNQKNDLGEHIFTEYLIQNFRNVVNNIPTLEFTMSNIYSLGFQRNDLYNLIENGVVINFRTSDNGYLPSFLITDSLMRTTFFYSPYGTKNLNLYLFGSKYFPSIFSTIKASLNLSQLTYHNTVDMGAVRQNKANTTSAVLFLRTAFGGIFDFENQITFSVTKTKSLSQNFFHKNSLENYTRLLLRLSKSWRMDATGNYYFTKIRTSSGNLFLDFSLRYQFKQKCEIRLYLKNLLNTHFFTIGEITDFSRVYQRIDVRSRQIHASCSFTF